MSDQSLTTGHLDYLQRTASEPGPIDPNDQRTWAPVWLRRVLHVHGIGRLDKAAIPPATAGDATTTAAEDRFRLVTEDLLAGLHTYQVPLAFVVRGQPGSVAVHVGTWLDDGNQPEEVDANAAVLRALLSSLYPAIDIDEVDSYLPQLGGAGLALGIPTAKPPEPADGALPLDRLIRAMSGAHWGVLVLAQPVGEAFVRDQRLQVINEMRARATDARTGGTPSPLADHYIDLLKATMVAMTGGQAVGAWRTAVYLLGDGDSYYRLSSAWRGIFSGSRSLPEPVRVWDRPEVEGLAEMWRMPSPPDYSDAPGLYRRPFEHQTLLTSAQLAAYVHLPDVETGGFRITVAPEFDTMPPERDDGFALGAVVERGGTTGRRYVLSPKAVTRHAFVAGVTGSGKTNTVFHLLQQTATLGVPFLVVEPTKTEYRALLDDPGLGPQLQVFTLGDENVSPFRLNPFEFPAGVPVGVHLDLLRSVFNVSFGMWTPLPQILETCLYRIYEERGWDITANRNRRLDDGSDRTQAFPTLTDLAMKVDEVVGELGYEEKVTGDLRAALRTRLDSLRTGGKGRMLDVQRSLPTELLTQRPTVFELDGMGDDDDKAFVMGLVMIRLVEHLRQLGEHDGLRHLLVIEEAHRLLAATGGPAQREDFQADVRGKAVETFANLLSEIRAYGEGVIVVDQVPSKLAPDVVKNTNLKLGHRIVAGDDRAVLASAMVMNDRQERALATLGLGQAAVFADGDDAPLLLQVPLAKGAAEAIPTAERVRSHMQASTDLAGLRTLFLPSVDCDESCASWPDACAVARRIVEDRAFQTTFSRMVLSAVFDPAAVDRSFPDLFMTVDALRPPWIEPATLLRTLAIHASRRFVTRRGAQAGWSYTTTDDLGTALHRMLVADPDTVAETRAVFQKLARETLGASFGPYPGCQQLWTGAETACACRFAVADLVAGGGFDAAWQQAGEADADAADTADGARPARWDVCQDAAYHLVDVSDDGGRRVAQRVALCFGQQMLARNPHMHPRTKRTLAQQLLMEAGLDEKPTGNV